MECNLLKELEQDVITKEVAEKVIEIVRREIKFLIKNNILITPSNYEKWFKVFCFIVENNKNLSDIEIFSLYEEHNLGKPNLLDGQALDIIHRKEVADSLEKIAEVIDEKLLEAIKLVYLHQDNIEVHTDLIKEELKDKEKEDKLLKILKEIYKLQNQNKKLIKKLEEYHKEITRLNVEIKIAKEEANIDFLTGLSNRRSFERSISDFLRDLKEKDYPFSLILVDIDNFKNINDTYGHPAGDVVLRELASIFKIFLRANTIIGRIGGEEFGIILPGVDLENASKVAERLRRIVQNRKITFSNKVINITASFGVTQAKKEDDVFSIYERADRALYKSKNNGKNRIEFEK